MALKRKIGKHNSNNYGDSMVIYASSGLAKVNSMHYGFQPNRKGPQNGRFLLISIMLDIHVGNSCWRYVGYSLLTTVTGFMLDIHL